jgi:negative regulator of flagellin synthesis FlgM
MEINGKSPLVDFNSRTSRLDLQESQSQRLQKAGGSTQSSDLDRVEFSTRSQEMQHIDELIRSTPDVREDAIQRVRSAIDNGTYNVNAEQVADKILGGSLIDQIF